MPKQTENNTTPTTCQICGRTIKAGKGVIAHHGYKRPGGGWQTASCSGTHHKPYEQSCDAIPPSIESVKAYIQRQEEYLEDFSSNPPAQLPYRRGGMFNPAPPVMVDRPDGFSPASYPTRRPGAYDTLYHARVYEVELELKHARRDLEYLKKRLADWSRVDSPVAVMNQDAKQPEQFEAPAPAISPVDRPFSRFITDADSESWVSLVNAYADELLNCPFDTNWLPGDSIVAKEMAAALIWARYCRETYEDEMFDDALLDKLYDSLDMVIPKPFNWKRHQVTVHEHRDILCKIVDQGLPDVPEPVTIPLLDMSLVVPVTMHPVEETYPFLALVNNGIPAIAALWSHYRDAISEHLRENGSFLNNMFRGLVSDELAAALLLHRIRIDEESINGLYLNDDGSFSSEHNALITEYLKNGGDLTAVRFLVEISGTRTLVADRQHIIEHFDELCQIVDQHQEPEAFEVTLATETEPHSDVVEAAKEILESMDALTVPFFSKPAPKQEYCECWTREEWVEETDEEDGGYFTYCQACGHDAPPSGVPKSEILIAERDALKAMLAEILEVEDMRMGVDQVKAHRDVIARARELLK